MVISNFVYGPELWFLLISLELLFPGREKCFGSLEFVARLSDGGFALPLVDLSWNFDRVASADFATDKFGEPDDWVELA